MEPLAEGTEALGSEPVASAPSLDGRAAVGRRAPFIEYPTPATSLAVPAALDVRAVPSAEGGATGLPAAEVLHTVEAHHQRLQGEATAERKSVAPPQQVLTTTASVAGALKQEGGDAIAAAGGRAPPPPVVLQTTNGRQVALAERATTEPDAATREAALDIFSEQETMAPSEQGGEMPPGDAEPPTAGAAAPLDAAPPLEGLEDLVVPPAVPDLIPEPADPVASVEAELAAPGGSDMEMADDGDLDVEEEEVLKPAAEPAPQIGRAHV